jgi:hypothetical protein
LLPVQAYSQPVGKIFRFRRRRWTKPRDYGAPKLRFWTGERRLKSLDEFQPSQRIRFWRDEERVTVRGVARDTLRWLGVLGSVSQRAEQR